MLTANKKSVKLADFGLAREETVTEMMTAETGTYRWMAPEVCSISFICNEHLHLSHCLNRPELQSKLNPHIQSVIAVVEQKISRIRCLFHFVVHISMNLDSEF